MSERSYGVASPEVLLSHDGLDFLQSMIAGTVPCPPICKVLNFHPVEAHKGRVVFEGQPDASYYNPINSVHGGWSATLLDSAMACAIFTTLIKGEGWVTLELKVNFVSAVTKDSGVMRAEGRLIHRGRTMATSEGDLKDKAGKLYAHATTTCMVFPKK